LVTRVAGDDRGENDNNDDKEGSLPSDKESLSDGNNDVRLLRNPPAAAVAIVVLVA